MSKLESSYVSGDYSYALDVMYAPIVEKMGGKQQGLASIKEMFSSHHIVLTSWKAHKPYRYAAGAGRLYAIVPCDAIMIIGGKKVTQSSYQLGIKISEAHWQFAGGSTLDQQNFKEFFPDFPRNIQPPKLSQQIEDYISPVKQTLDTYKIGETSFKDFEKDAGLTEFGFPEAKIAPTNFVTVAAPLIKPDRGGKSYRLNDNSPWKIFEQRQEFKRHNSEDSFTVKLVVGDEGGEFAS